MQHRGGKEQLEQGGLGRGLGEVGGLGLQHKASQMDNGKDKECFHLQVFQVFLEFQS